MAVDDLDEKKSIDLMDLKYDELAALTQAHLKYILFKEISSSHFMKFPEEYKQTFIVEVAIDLLIEMIFCSSRKDKKSLSYNKKEVIEHFKEKFDEFIEKKMKNND